MYKGPTDKAKDGYDWGWEVVVGGAGESGVGKVETMYLNNNKKIKLKKQLKKISALSNTKVENMLSEECQ